jgi:hypothetical protein
MKVYWRSGGIAPCILDLCSGWRLVDPHLGLLKVSINFLSFILLACRPLPIYMPHYVLDLLLPLSELSLY